MIHEEVALCVASKEEVEKNKKYLIMVDGMTDWNLPHPINGYEVIPETVSQFTGFLDKNGREIYDGDYNSDGEMFTWCNNCGGWTIAQLDLPTKDIVIPCHWCEGDFHWADVIEEFEIAGNVHEISDDNGNKS